MVVTEGQYDFSFFDYVISKAKEKGLHVISGMGRTEGAYSST